jgi:hypothetical protein
MCQDGVVNKLSAWTFINLAFVPAFISARNGRYEILMISGFSSGFGLLELVIVMASLYSLPSKESD